MVKKSKTDSAQDLIDSLLDEQSQKDVRVEKDAAPAAPPIPKQKLSLSSKEKSVVKTMVFEISPDKADPTRAFGLVSDRSHMIALNRPKGTEQVEKAAKAEKNVKNVKAEEPKMSQSEIRRAPTAVMLNYDNAKPQTPAADKTIRLPAFSKSSAVDESEIPRFQPQPVQVPLNATEASLKQSESLRVAQSRIHDLEAELDRLRRENEKLASAGETLRRRTDELLAKNESLESQSRESEKISEGERRVMQDQLNRKERENIELRSKLEETETRLESNFKKIRVRERELEHRLEIVKMESQTLVSTKDDMIMRLKREIDQMRFEIENSKVRSQELFNQYKEKQETIRRVVRALRIALTTLEGDEEKPGLKKAE